MEHRWGERVSLHLTVELSGGGSSPPIAGSLENVSASGAFVRRAGRGPGRGPVEVTLRGRVSGRVQRVRLLAYVVRETEAGVGIEWCEFAPRVVRELIVRDRRAGATRTRASVLPSPRRPPRRPKTGMEPIAQSAGEPVAIDVRPI